MNSKILLAHGTSREAHIVTSKDSDREFVNALIFYQNGRLNLRHTSHTFTERKAWLKKPVLVNVNSNFPVVATKYLVVTIGCHNRRVEYSGPH